MINEENKDAYQNLATIIVETLEETGTDLTVFHDGSVHVDDLSTSIANTTNLETSYQLNKENVNEGYIILSDRTIYINYHLEDPEVLTLPKVFVIDTIPGVEEEALKKLQESIVQSIQKLHDNHDINTISNYTFPSGETLNETYKDSILYGGETDYRKHPEGVSPWEPEQWKSEK